MNREDYAKSLEGLSEEKQTELLKHFDNQEEAVKVYGNKDHFENLKKERDDAKKKVKELEDSKAAAEAEANKQQGKFKELYETEQNKAKTLEAEVEKLKPYQEKLTTYETSDKVRMLNQIEDADLKKELETKSYDEIRLAHSVYQRTKPKSKTGNDNGRSGLVLDDSKKWDDYSTAELTEISTKHPDLYKKLEKQRYGKNY